MATSAEKLLLDEAARFTHNKPMGRMRSQDRPELLYPSDARTELIHTEQEADGFTVKTYRVFKNDDVDTYKVRVKAGKSHLKVSSSVLHFHGV
eukprot:m.87449 g.87449  ORF g.87449 m.87449 type:complete len:93 (-) comp19930_c0_seq7:861-1139(-)